MKTPSPFKGWSMETLKTTYNDTLDEMQQLVAHPNFIPNAKFDKFSLETIKRCQYLADYAKGLKLVIKARTKRK